MTKDKKILDDTQEDLFMSELEYEFDDINEDIDMKELEELEALLNESVDSELSELNFLSSEYDKIGNPDSLGSTVMGVVWEQFENQIGVTLGEEFIESNGGLNLDLRNSAHIQTTENFEKGKIATHNTEINYQERYNNYQSRFQKNPDGSIKTRVNPRTGEDIKVLKKEFRKPFDENRDKGSGNVDKDHTISAAEIARDAEANAHMSQNEQVEFANSEKNLKDMDSSANKSKGDSKMEEWLESERDGKKPAERFNIDEDECRENDKVARDEYDKRKKEGKKESVKTGRISQAKETLRISGKALQGMVLSLLFQLLKKIFQKFVLWLKSKERDIKSLCSYIKEAISDFISDIKKHVVNAGNIAVTTIATAILGPIVGTVKKAWMALKQSARTIKECIAALKDPNNSNKPIDELMCEVGKIVITGSTAVSSIVLGQAIEKALLVVPGMQVPIPIIGNLASVIGIFLGGLVAGLIGALAINIINKKIAKKKKDANLKEQNEKQNIILHNQHIQYNIDRELLSKQKHMNEVHIQNRHAQFTDVARTIMNDISDVINMTDNSDDYIISDDVVQYNQEMNDLLKKIDN